MSGQRPWTGVDPGDDALPSEAVEGAARILIRVNAEDPDAMFAEMRRGLVRSPREISSRYFYDDAGSALFERICELPEYYPTRTEDAILRAAAEDIVTRSGAEELVELGPGAAVKTRILLDAFRRRGRLRRIVLFDVSEGMVRRVAAELSEEYPEARVHGIVGDFTIHLDEIPGTERRLVVFLGGTIGNFPPEPAVRFLSGVGARLRPGDAFLLGTDLIKDRARLHAAYNDAQGVTAAFNRNILRVVNRLLAADFVPEAFEHVAFYNEAEHRIEMWLRATRAQRVRLPRLDLTLDVAPGESILTETSAKYDRTMVESMLRAAGFTLERWTTDPEALFALSLSRRS